MCKINCSGGCIECAPEEHIKNLQEQVATLTKERDEWKAMAKACSDWGEERRQAALDALEMAMERKDHLDALTKERENLRDKLISIQVEIGDLIPAVDGERANDRITGRVARVVNQLAAAQATIERLREALQDIRSHATSTGCRLASKALAAINAKATPAGAAPLPDAQLCRFYDVDNFPDLVAAMDHHIEKLQAKLPPTPSLKPTRVREG